MAKDEPSNQELFRIGIETKEALRAYVERSDKWREDTTIKLAYANGRTGDSEKAIRILGDNYSNLSVKVAELNNKYWWVAGICATVLVIGGIFARLYIQDIAGKVVSQALEPYELPAK